MKTAQVTKNQHIVPQRHLKNFLIPNNTKLECFNVDALRLEKQQSPSSICSGYFHYAIEPGREDEYSQIVEKAFGDIEDWYGKNIDRIEKLLISKQKLSDDDRYAVSWIISNFYFRGYKFRSQTRVMLNQLMEWLAPNISDHIYNQCVLKYPAIFSDNKKSKEIARKVVNEELNIYAKNTKYATNRTFDVGFANTLTHKKWTILVNNSSNSPFITGDEAVIEISNEIIPKSIVSNSFLCLTHIFHLSEKIAIVASFTSSEQEHGDTVFDDISDNKIKISQENLLYVNHTYKYCYSSDKTFFKWLINFEKTKKSKYEN